MAAIGSYLACFSIAAAMKLIACSTIAGPADLGLPAWNGGSGSYSIANCVNFAASSPRNFGEHYQSKIDPSRDAASRDAVSVYYYRASIGSAANMRRASRVAQWDVALYPLSKPAAPSRSDPLHTEVTYFDREARSPRKARASRSCIIAC